MTGKRTRGITPSRARERLAELEESIKARQARLEQVEARLSKLPEPDPKLVDFQEKLERKQKIEKSQVAKLQALLAARVRQESQEEYRSSEEGFPSEEMIELRKSYEDLRKGLSDIREQVEKAERPRDLLSRLDVFEERLERRETAAKNIYQEVVGLQAALDQERQWVRRLSRNQSDQDERFETLREAVEESVLAAMDLAQKVDEMEERPLGPQARKLAGLTRKTMTRLDEIEEQLQMLSVQMSQELTSFEQQWSSRESVPEFDRLLERLGRLESRLEEVVRRGAGGHDDLFVYENPTPRLDFELFEEGLEILN
ncbi:MAG: hypothetical protein KC910_00760 [Candidatus Eremiobacteraeota bacterium]|nr:hypothetical protein [Candidatus Eremiobacteraeota bacterium]